MRNIIILTSTLLGFVGLYFFTNYFHADFSIVLFLFLTGACFGSFAVATVWRLRFRQLSDDKDSNHKLTKEENKEYKLLKSRFAKTSIFSKNKDVTKDRSVCLSCGRQLTVWENIPIFSWLFLGGKCKTCKKPIGKAEFLSEIGTAILFVVSYVFWPFADGFSLVVWPDLILGFLWLVVTVCLVIHIVYDFKWLLLLDKITVIIFVCSLIILVINLTTKQQIDWFSVGINIVLSLAILPIFYGILFYISRGRWIGFGDVKLLLPLSLILPSWMAAFLVLFLSNVIGLLWIVPAIKTKKITRKTRVPFGPFLIIAFFISILWGNDLINLYFGLLGL